MITSIGGATICRGGGGGGGGPDMEARHLAQK